MGTTARCAVLLSLVAASGAYGVRLPLGTSGAAFTGGEADVKAVPEFPASDPAFEKKGRSVSETTAIKADAGISARLLIKGTGPNALNSGVVTTRLPASAPYAKLAIYSSSGILLDDWIVDASSGHAALPVDDYALGTYTFAYSVPGSLVSKVQVALNGGPVSPSPVWRFGDLDGDNVVSQAEVSFVQASVGQSATSVNAYFPQSSAAYSVRDADFNGDGTITQADVDLATPNLGVYGD